MKSRLAFSLVGEFTEYKYTRYQFAPTELQESLIIPVKRDKFMVRFTRSRDESHSNDLEFSRCHAGLLYRVTIELLDLERGKHYSQCFYYESNQIDYAVCWGRFLLSWERCRKESGKPVSLNLDRIVSRYLP